jgi:hypothetical protein
VIRECGGKMHMALREWELARNDFFDAFKNYDEAGLGRRIQCLKYLILSNMLMNSDISPFDSQARLQWGGESIINRGEGLQEHERRRIYFLGHTFFYRCLLPCAAPEATP